MPRPHKFARPTKDGSTPYKHARSHFRTLEQKSSIFFRLPLELREMVYGFVLPGSYRAFVPFDWEGRENGGRDFIWHHQYPLCTWQTGSMSILCACKRINSEATPFFYKTNVFDVSIQGRMPMLGIYYAVDGAEFDGGDDVRFRTQKFSSFNSRYLALVTKWCVSFPNHYGLNYCYQDLDAIDERSYGKLSHARLQHRKEVVIGLRYWLSLLGPHDKAKTRIRHLEFTFFSYLDCVGRFGECDPKLFDEIARVLPLWMKQQCTQLNGINLPDL